MRVFVRWGGGEGEGITRVGGEEERVGGVWWCVCVHLCDISPTEVGDMVMISSSFRYLRL